MTDILKIIILGIVEGVTEWLPISSTGHLILAGNVLQPGFSAGFMDLFNVLVQLGAIIAVIVIFFNKLWPFHTSAKRPSDSQFMYPADGGFAARFQNFADNHLYMNRLALWLRIAVSSVPAMAVGLFCEDWLEEHMHSPVPVAVMLIVFGLIFFVVENRRSETGFRIGSVAHITYTDALLIGCFQALALLPGTSRSGATIIGALIIGLSRPCAARYSFYLAIPAMLGGSLISLLKTDVTLAPAEAGALVLGMAVAFVVSMFIVRFLMRFIANHTFKVFGWYRIALGAAVLIAAAFSLI